jgi:hypothetical protein
MPQNINFIYEMFPKVPVVQHLSEHFIIKYNIKITKTLMSIQILDTYHYVNNLQASSG